MPSAVGITLEQAQAALAGAIYLGPRKKQVHSQGNVPYVLLGTGLLWFGWLGFNAGSALGANADAVIAFTNTNIASATAMITWLFYERMLGRMMSTIGACIGAVVGLVASTPAACAPPMTEMRELGQLHRKRGE